MGNSCIVYSEIMQSNWKLMDCTPEDVLGVSLVSWWSDGWTCAYKWAVRTDTHNRRAKKKTRTPAKEGPYLHKKMCFQSIKQYFNSTITEILLFSLLLHSSVFTGRIPSMYICLDWCVFCFTVDMKMWSHHSCLYYVTHFNMKSGL